MIFKKVLLLPLLVVGLSTNSLNAQLIDNAVSICPLKGDAVFAGNPPLDNLDQNMCEIHIASELCQSVQDKSELMNCSERDLSLGAQQKNYIEMFYRCVEGAFWDAPRTFVKFVWTVLKWVWKTSVISPVKRAQEAGELAGSVKLYLANEYDKAYEKASPPGKAAKAASQVAPAIFKMLYEKIEAIVAHESKRFSCLNSKAKSNRVCAVAAEFIIPPAAAFALLRNTRHISKITKAKGSISNSKISKLTPSEIRSLYAHQIKAFTPEQIKLLTPKQLRAFNRHQMKVFTPEQVKALTPKQLQDFTISQLTPFQIKAFTPNQIKGFNKSNINSLYPHQIKALTPDQIKSLTPKQIGYFDLHQIKEIAPSQIKALTPDQIKGFRTEQMAYLFPDQLKALTPQQFKAFSPEQIKSLYPHQIEKLAPNQIKALTRKQAKALTPKQIKALTDEQTKALTTENFEAIFLKYIH